MEPVIKGGILGVLFTWLMMAPASALVVFNESLPQHSTAQQEEATRPMDERLATLAQQRQLTYDVALYHYYTQAPYKALLQLETATTQGIFTNSTHYAALLNSELLLHFGLYEEADKKIQRLLQQDALPQTRAMILLKRAQMDYRNGNHEAAVTQLEALAEHPLPKDAELQRRLLLTNILIQQNKLSQAENVLSRASLQHPDGGYLGYNLGVLMIRSQHIEAGLTMLTKVVERPHNSEEDEALKDRALLAIGLTELQRHRYATARRYLTLVRHDSPYAKQALHATALAYYLDQEPQKALPYWEHLQTYPHEDATVQESLLFSAHAQEQLGDLAAAQQHYAQAIKSLQALVSTLESLADNLTTQWPDSLIATHRTLAGELSTSTLSQLASQPHSLLLERLFTNPDFLNTLHEYEEVKTLQHTLAEQLKHINALKSLGSAVQTLVLEDHKALKKIAESVLAPQGKNTPSEPITALPLAPTWAFYEQRIQQQQQGASTLEKALNQRLVAMAKHHIQEDVARLQDLLAEAHLAAARVQDERLGL